jgi:hypothetical protein
MKHNSNFNISDSSYISAQIIKSNHKFIDTTLIKDFKFVKVEYLKRNYYFRYDSIMVFYYPIFTNDKKCVYINFHYQGSGSVYFEI